MKFIIGTLTLLLSPLALIGILANVVSVVIYFGWYISDKIVLNWDKK